MKYIVFDLEWNQSFSPSPEQVAALPFEIVEIGAVRLTDEGKLVGEFDELVKPEVYHQLNHITSRLIHLQMQELMRGKPFPEVARQFYDWCGTEEEYRLCSWGPQDVGEFQRNLHYHKMTPLSEGPVPFLDIQKLFSIAYEDRKSRRSLEDAVDMLQIEKDIPFHRAFSDAYYTAQVLARILAEKPEVLDYVSYDVTNPPRTREDELHVTFDTYAKYISRAFPSREKALADREVTSTKCYLCHRNLKKRINWFTDNGRNYFAMAYCDKHGYLKGKIRVRKAWDDSVYVVKTTKLVPAETAEQLANKEAHIREQHKKHRRKKQCTI